MKIVPISEGHVRVELDKGVGFDIYQLIGGGLEIQEAKGEKLLVKTSEEGVVIRAEKE